MASRLALVSDQDRMEQARILAEQVTAEVAQVVLGKDREIQMAFTCILAGGHLLIEDVPGVGKTLLVRALAIALGLEFRRIQFTSDMLPADIIGISIYDQQSMSFLFHQGPIFAQLILADEVNRATPKAQSALLEAMEEHQVTTDSETHELPEPFFVIATQNPSHQIGTFPLPESQLDRFLMRIGLGYPDKPLERELLRGENRRAMLEQLRPIVTGQDISELQKVAREVHVSDSLLDYAQALVFATRNAPEIELGLSPRGAQDLMAAARCRAMISGHRGVHPEDIKAVFTAVAAHRIQVRDDMMQNASDLTQQILDSVPVP
jgi:MoxR-like ATPase